MDNAAQRGAYLARAGNCMSCHTPAGGMAYAGGRAIDTPFGTLWSGNLTPDRETGLGKWTPDDFWRAMHQGRSRDGRALYPAFPYPYFTRISRQDSDDLFAYLQTLPPVSKAQRPHELRWPYGSPVALNLWRWLYFREGPAATEPNRDPRWLRGAYLVQGLSHCGACHTPRNRWGASQDALDLGGAMMPDQKWFAPSLRSGAQGGLGDWSAQDIVALLRTGVSARGGSSGPMARVVLHGTQHLDPVDLEAMAVYLQSLGPGKDTTTAPVADAGPLHGKGLTAPTGKGRRDGVVLYDRHCAACHGEAGEGRPGVYPPLAGNRTVQQNPINNLIQIVLNGGYGPATTGNPRPHGMPPFVLQLDDADLAALLSHIRSAWGHRAAPVTELQVQQARKTP
ncbi:MAG: c-type cytochrome [Rhodoferax sp.]|nr:c-type cytochrome [Rhodoferax sp.]